MPDERFTRWFEAQGYPSPEDRYDGDEMAGAFTAGTQAESDRVGATPAEARPRADWTVDPETGRTNASPAFRGLVGEVERLLRGGAGGVVLGESWTSGTAALIVAQLAHVHHLAPAAPAGQLQVLLGDWRNTLASLEDRGQEGTQRARTATAVERNVLRVVIGQVEAAISADAGPDAAAGRPTTSLEDSMLANIDKLNDLVRDMLQAFPDTADEQEWRDRAGTLGVCDPDGLSYRAYTEEDL